MAWIISHHQRIKDKPEPKFGKKKAILKTKPKVSKEDLKYLEWLQHQELRCIVCGSYKVEFHHMKRDSTDKKNHKRLIPLCREHHTQSAELSAHGTPVKFRELYPMESQIEMADKIYNYYVKEKQ